MMRVDNGWKVRIGAQWFPDAQIALDIQGSAVRTEQAQQEARLLRDALQRHHALQARIDELEKQLAMRTLIETEIDDEAEDPA